MQRFAGFVVRHRRLVLLVAALLLIPSVFGAVGTYINYDILTYLPPELDSMVGEEYLDQDFNMASTAMITVEHMRPTQLTALAEKIAEIPGVDKVTSPTDLLDVTIPSSMMPKDIEDFFYGKNGSAMLLVRFAEPTASISTMKAVRQIQELLDKDCFIGGMAAILADTKDLVDKEMPLYVVCAVGCSLLVLYMSIHATAVPLLFMLSIAFPIIYNFGSNIFLGQISYITEALATVLQLGVTMDFSIFLLHRFEEETHKAGVREGEAASPEIAEQAMIQAICSTFSSIAGSSLTTIAGFLAMCTMSLRLGADIGIVMAKGVLLGVVCTVTILPALLMIFNKAVARHRHRTLIPRLSRTSHFVVNHYRPIIIVFLLLIVPAAFAQSKTQVYYTLFDSLPQEMPGIVGTNVLKEDFDMTTTHFVMVDDNLSSDKMAQLTRELEQVEGVGQALSYEKFLGGGIPQSFVPQDVSEIFHGGNHRMILVNSQYASGTERMTHQLEQMNEIVKQYDPNGVISGEGAMTKDLINIADIDFRNVNITSILAVFLVIAIVFRSISIPILLVAAIESAITINMAIPYFNGSILPFVASIVVGTIQLGATVDYAILVTTRFKEELSAGHTVKQAVQISVEQSSRSILTSGLTFFVATASVAFASKMELLSSLCMLISRGALISMAVIILILPALLIITAPLIQKTTIRWPKIQKERV